MRSNPSPAHLAQLFLRPRLVRPLKDCTKEEEEKENKEMVGANSSQSRTRTRTYYPRKCKNTRLSIHECIPDDILFQILLLLPPQDIYYSSRLVCGKWYRIMRTKTFIHKHLEHASYGLLYRGESDALESLGSTDVVFISLRQDAGGGIFDTYKLNYLRRNTLWSSCNGLMLQVRKNSPHTVFFVTNPLTNQSFCLPPYPYPLLSHVKSGIGYDAASMTYKVVIPPYTDTTPQIGCGILTVGVDKSWRKIRTDHLSDHGKSTSFSYAVLTEGFVHWLGGIRLKSLNLETEIITETPLPIPGAVLLEEKTECHCMSTGRFLSLFLQRKKFVWEVFEMKPGTGEWRKLPNIYLEGQKGMLERLGFKPDNVVIKPCGWLKYPEVLALRVQSVFIIFYNLITCEISAEKLRTCSCFLPITLHKNSLSRVHQPRCTSLPMELVDPLSIKKDACWTISNITAGNRYKIQAVIEAGLIGPLVNLLNWISKKRLLVRRNQRENHESYLCILENKLRAATLEVPIILPN